MMEMGIETDLLCGEPKEMLECFIIECKGYRKQRDFLDR